MQPITYIDRATGQRHTESPPGERFLTFLYHHPLGELALSLLVKRKALSALYGRFMRSASSKKDIAPFIDTYEVNPSEFVKPVDRFASFNDFFIRELMPGARPLQEGLVSPADGKVLAFPDVSALNDLFVKGQRFTLTAFLRNAYLAEKHQDSSLFVIRLAPPDYHRFHFPYGGQATPPRPISGAYFSVSPYATREHFARVFCENKRSYTLLTTPDRGEIVLAPVGATMVGSIIHRYDENAPIQKGDEMGYFEFGGSCLIMLVEKGQVTIDEDLLTNTAQGLETTIKMGERLGG